MTPFRPIWNRLDSHGKAVFVVILIDLPFLIVALGLTAWSLQGYASALSLIRGYNNESNTNTATTSRALFSTRPTSAASLTRLTRAYYTTYTSTITRYDVIRISGTTNFQTYTNSDGSPSLTIQLGSTSRSAYTTFTTTVSRYSLSRYRRHEPTPSPSLQLGTKSQAQPTQAPLTETSPRVALDRYQPLSQDNRLVRQASLYRRQSTTGFTAQEYLRVSTVIVALVSILLAAICVRFLLDLIFLAILSKGYQRSSIHHHLLTTTSRWFSIITIISTIILFAFAVAYIVYTNEQFGPGGRYIAPFIVFWMLSCLTGIGISITAFRLRDSSRKKAFSPRDSCIEDEDNEENHEQQEDIQLSNRSQSSQPVSSLGRTEYQAVPQSSQGHSTELHMEQNVWQSDSQAQESSVRQAPLASPTPPQEHTCKYPPPSYSIANH